MSDFGASNIKSVRFTLVPPTTATSGNVALTFNPEPIIGQIIGFEIGSPAFDAATGSLYVFCSGTNWPGGNRQVFQQNGVTAILRTFYPIVEFQRNSIQGTLLSGVAYSATDNPWVVSEAVGFAASGTYNGTGNILLYYK